MEAMSVFNPASETAQAFILRNFSSLLQQVADDDIDEGSLSGLLAILHPANGRLGSSFEVSYSNREGVSRSLDALKNSIGFVGDLLVTQIDACNWQATGYIEKIAMRRLPENAIEITLTIYRADLPYSLIHSSTTPDQPTH